MKKYSIRILLGLLVIVLISGCSRQSNNKWTSMEITRVDEIANLSVDWNGSTYTNNYLGFEITVPEEWVKNQPAELKIIEEIMSEKYDIFFQGQENDVENYADEIIVMRAKSTNADMLSDDVYLMVIPTFNNDVEAFMKHQHDSNVEEFSDVDTITVSKIASTKLGGDNTISYGLQIEYEDETYHQLYFSYYKEGYFVIFSAAFNENSEEDINQILETVIIDK